MLMYIDYGLIVAFFVVLLLMVLVVIQRRPGAAALQADASTGKVPALPQNKLSYILLAALFVLLFVLALFVEKE